MRVFVVGTIRRPRLALCALLSGLFLVAASPAGAADIMVTSGSLDMRPDAGPIVLEGDRGFRLQGGIAAIGGLFDPLFMCNYLIGSCSPGDTIQLRGEWSSGDAPGVFTLDGITYGSGNMAATRLVFGGSFVLPPFPAAAVTTVVTAPFIFDGALSYVPLGQVGAQERLFGGGVATISMVPDPVIIGRWKMTEILYVFADRLPAPWRATDVGVTGTSGRAEHSNGSYIVHGDGGDIWGTADSFHFVYQPISNSGAVEARVVVQERTHQFAKAGVMLRSSIDPSSPSVVLDVKPDGGIEFMVRYARGEPTIFVAGAAAVASGVILQLARSAANTITASYSTDGLGWSEIGSVTVPFELELLAGLAVTSHDATTLNNALFDRVTVSATKPSLNLLDEGDFEGYDPPVLGPPGWISDDGFRQTAAKSETHQPRSGQKNGACWTPEFLDCGMFQEVIAPETAQYQLRFYASADRPGGLVGANVNGMTAATAAVGPAPFGEYAPYVMTFTARAGDVVRVWMYSPAVPGYVVIDDVSLTQAEVGSHSITSGTWTIFWAPPPEGAFSLSGESFSIDGTYASGEVQALSMCGSGHRCVPGQAVGLDASFYNETPVEFDSYSHGTATVFGVSYPFVEFAGSVKLDGSFVILPEPVVVEFPELVTVSGPFVLSGTMKGYNVRGVRPTLMFELPLTGHGTATLKLLAEPATEGHLQLLFHALTYAFE
jgi:hypothetical protein